jgi:tetratricopeptide (TPR) repeat protein
MRLLGIAGVLFAVGVAALPAQQNSKEGQTQAAPAQAPKGPAPKSQGELQALQAVFQAQNNPDALIKAADDLLTKYADTDFKSTVLLMEATAYQQKGDRVRAQTFAEQAVNADPNSYQAELTLGELIAQGTQEHDLDREEKLTKAEKLINTALEQIKTAPKPNPQLPDAQWDDAKKYLTAKGYDALGMVAMARKNFDAASKQFKLAADTDPQEPAYQVRLASSYEQGGKNDEAIAVCDKVMATPNIHPQIRQVAQAIRAQAIQHGGKNTTPPPAPGAAATPGAAPAQGAAPAAPPPPPAEKKQ